jgi:diacylglycerol kinase (ATP)
MTHPQKVRGGLERIVHATGYSLAGLGAAWRHESAFRQECVVGLVLLPAAVWLGQSWIESALLIGSVLLVLIVELLNSGIEAAIDRDSMEINPLGKRAKDLGSAAVMLSLMLAGGIWVAVLFTRFVL